VVPFSRFAGWQSSRAGACAMAAAGTASDAKSANTILDMLEATPKSPIQLDFLF